MKRDLPDHMCPKCFGDYRGKVGCVCHLQGVARLLEWVVIPALLLLLVAMLGAFVWAGISDSFSLCDITPNTNECRWRDA